MRNPYTLFHKDLNYVADNNKGYVIIMFVLILVPLIGLMALAIDLGQISRIRYTAQRAVDAATLSAINFRASMEYQAATNTPLFPGFPAPGLYADNPDVITQMYDVINNNLRISKIDLSTIEIQSDTGPFETASFVEGARAKVIAHVPLLLAPVARFLSGTTSLDVQVESQVQLRPAVYVVLADLSGSMGCSSINETTATGCDCFPNRRNPNFCGHSSNFNTKASLIHPLFWRMLSHVNYHHDNLFFYNFATTTKRVWPSTLPNPASPEGMDPMDIGTLILLEILMENWYYSPQADVNFLGIPNGPDRLPAGVAGSNLFAAMKTAYTDLWRSGLITQDRDINWIIITDGALTGSTFSFDLSELTDNTLKPCEQPTSTSYATDDVYDTLVYSIDMAGPPTTGRFLFTSPPLVFQEGHPAQLFERWRFNRENPFPFYAAIDQAEIIAQPATDLKAYYSFCRATFVTGSWDPSGDPNFSGPQGCDPTATYPAGHMCNFPDGYWKCDSVDLAQAPPYSYKISSRTYLDPYGDPKTVTADVDDVCWFQEQWASIQSGIKQNPNCNLPKGSRLSGSCGGWTSPMPEQASFYLPNGIGNWNNADNIYRQSFNNAFAGILQNNFSFSVPRVKTTADPTRYPAPLFDPGAPYNSILGPRLSYSVPLDRLRNGLGAGVSGQMEYRRLFYNSAIMMADYLRNLAIYGNVRSSRVYTIGLGVKDTGITFYQDDDTATPDPFSNTNLRKDNFLYRLANDPYAPGAPSCTTNNEVDTNTTYLDSYGVGGSDIYRWHHYCGREAPAPDDNVPDPHRVCGKHFPATSEFELLSALEQIMHQTLMQLF